jgi:metal iron transporter
MNCPSRTDEPEDSGFNQSPNALAADLTTRQDLNGIANSRLLLRRTASSDVENVVVVVDEPGDLRERKAGENEKGGIGEATLERTRAGSHEVAEGARGGGNGLVRTSTTVLEVLKKFGRFIGPGFMVSISPYPGFIIPV